ncbi:MAG: hypothetical protein LBB18_01355 [Puniceicoccales bacterium]|jgi:hypothetical protein|nr:hypothetical protein [Puniceicoccales bacterium]
MVNGNVGTGGMVNTSASTGGIGCDFEKWITQGLANWDSRSFKNVSLATIIGTARNITSSCLADLSPALVAAKDHSYEAIANASKWVVSNIKSASEYAVSTAPTLGRTLLDFCASHPIFIAALTILIVTNPSAKKAIKNLVKLAVLDIPGAGISLAFVPVKVILKLCTMFIGQVVRTFTPNRILTAKKIASLRKEIAACNGKIAVMTTEVTAERWIVERLRTFGGSKPATHEIKVHTRHIGVLDKRIQDEQNKCGSFSAELLKIAGNGGGAILADGAQQFAPLPYLPAAPQQLGIPIVQQPQFQQAPQLAQAMAQPQQQYQYQAVGHQQMLPPQFNAIPPQQQLPSAAWQQQFPQQWQYPVFQYFPAPFPPLPQPFPQPGIDVPQPPQSAEATGQQPD